MNATSSVPGLPGEILVLSAAAGAGHVSAAEALVEALRGRGEAARHEEVLRHTNPIFKRLYADLYLELVNHQPELLGWMYDALDKPWQFQKRRLALDRLNTGPLKTLLRRHPPRLALCTHFLPAEILLHLRRKDGLRIPLGVVVTDLDAHALWLYRDVDWYFVAREETRAHLARLGIPPETIFVTGIPVHPSFAVPRSRREVRIALGLDPDLTTILVVAGGFGVGPVESIVREVRGVRGPIQVAAICGKNARLEKKLRELPAGEGAPLHVVGFTREMSEWMAAADLFVGKAGGLSSSEALARGLVLVIVNPIPGQEERNADHFLEEGVAIRCNTLATLSWKISALLEDGARLDRMRENVARLRRPDAAARIVSIVLDGERRPRG
jgi:processive 1,2-diacylglycerol beta-glucosyltransferase